MRMHHRLSSLFFRSSLRRQLLSLTLIGAASLFAASSAQAAVEVTIDKDNQQMTVAVDGATRYTWPVSTGIPSRETPNGTFRAFRMEEDHYSKEFDDAPMPHSIFFTKIGHAIHGTDSVNRLGTPASHGCVRLSRDHAATLYALVEKEGVLNTTVTLTGSASVALARGPSGKSRLARGEAGDPVQLTPSGVSAQATAAPTEMYVDQYGRPVNVAPRGFAANPYAGDGYASNSNPSNSYESNAYQPRRVYQPRQQVQQPYDAADSYYARPYQPRTQFYYSDQ